MGEKRPPPPLCNALLNTEMGGKRRIAEGGRGERARGRERGASNKSFIAREWGTAASVSLGGAAAVAAVAFDPQQ